MDRSSSIPISFFGSLGFQRSRLSARPAPPKPRHLPRPPSPARAVPVIPAPALTSAPVPASPCPSLESALPSRQIVRLQPHPQSGLPPTLIQLGPSSVLSTSTAHPVVISRLRPLLPIHLDHRLSLHRLRFLSIPSTPALAPIHHDISRSLRKFWQAPSPSIPVHVPNLLHIPDSIASRGGAALLLPDSERPSIQR